MGAALPAAWEVEASGVDCESLEAAFSASVLDEAWPDSPGWSLAKSSGLSEGDAVSGGVEEVMVA